jgi:hypothetical protein
MTVLASSLMPDVVERAAVMTIICGAIGGARGVDPTANTQPGKSP